MVKNISKRIVSLFMAALMLCSVCSFATVDADAAKYTDNCDVIEVMGESPYYSGKFECDNTFYFGKVKSAKKVKIQFRNFCCGLTPDQEKFYKEYTRYNVYVCSGNTVKKFYIKKAGRTFKIPKGNDMKVWIHSYIDSSGWDQFEDHMRSNKNNWQFAQYRLKY